MHVLKGHLILLFSGKVLDSLVGFEMIFDVMDFSLVVNPLEGMGGISIHESVSVWSSSIREQNSDLMKSLWRVLPEVKDHVRVSQVGGWISLLAVDEIWEFHWVIDEEDWSIVSNHIVVALFGVEFDGESSWVSDGVRSSSLTGDGGESEEQWGLLADFVEEGSLGEWSDILGNLENSMGSGTLGMDNSLWDSLSVEVSKLVNQVEVLEQNWSVWASGH